MKDDKKIGKIIEPIKKYWKKEIIRQESEDRIKMNEKEGILIEEGLVDLDGDFSEIAIDDIIIQLEKGEILLVNTRNNMEVIGKIVGIDGNDVQVKFISKYSHLGDMLIAAQKEGLKYKLQFNGKIKEEHTDELENRIIDDIEIFSVSIKTINPIMPVKQGKFTELAEKLMKESEYKFY